MRAGSPGMKSDRGPGPARLPTGGTGWPTTRCLTPPCGRATGKRWRASTSFAVPRSPLPAGAGADGCAAAGPSRSGAHAVGKAPGREDPGLGFRDENAPVARRHGARWRGSVPGAHSPFPHFLDPQYLRLFTVSCFGFRSPQVIGSPESCGACSGCKLLQCIRRVRGARGPWTRWGLGPGPRV